MAKVYKEDGTFYYYYYKKVGKKRKTGKKLKRGRSWQETWDFKIMSFKSNVQDEYIGKYRNIAEVEVARKILQERNDSVIFPVRYVVKKRVVPFKCEYVVLKKNRDSVEEPVVSKLRNEYGKLIGNMTTSKSWIVYDKFPKLIEEKFWVYGYNPRRNRKEYRWIDDNLIKERATEPYSFVQVFLYNNKVFFKYDGIPMAFVICKNISDASRMYTMLQESHRKERNVIFIGKLRKNSDRMRDVTDYMREVTGWTDAKIYRTTTK